MSAEILAYNKAQSAADRKICDALARAIERNLAQAECKVWHRHPVWFIDGNPIVGYSKLKADGGAIRLMFWSGESFDEPGLQKDPPESRFKSAGARYTDAGQIVEKDLRRWLDKSVEIQWDYKNLVKRRGRLVRVK
ncbi:MAG: DUF1801 domain-containing protein [Phycisphaerales bacterium]|nr:DUF1801 domain-containing protein [Phycisphaerales bacterium]